MATVQELETELTAINEQTNAISTVLVEVSSDVDDLIAKVQAGDVTNAIALAQGIKTSLGGMSTEVGNIAAKHTTDTPTPPVA